MKLVVPTRAFKNDYKRAKKRNFEIDKLKKLVQLLADDKPLPAHARAHKLVGNYVGLWECHIESDWLLIYQYRDNEELILCRTGSHSALFK